jgi:multiple sugar transport system permease protein
MTVQRRRRRGDVMTYAAFFFCLIFFGLPLLWLISLSFRTAEEVYTAALKFIPENPTTFNYTSVLSSGRFQQYLLNSLKLTMAGSIGAMLFAAPAAYAASRMNFRGRPLFLIGVLSLQMISPLVIMIPLYRYFADLGLLDSHLSTAFVYMAILVPLATWMLKGFFDGIPKELDEAAFVDGANRFQAFLRVLLPVSVPGFAAAFVLTAILAWGEFVVPYILLSEPAMQPVSVGILAFQGSFAQTATQILAAGAILAMVPAVAVFVALQRFIVQALTSGAVKG